MIFCCCITTAEQALLPNDILIYRFFYLQYNDFRKKKVKRKLNKFKDKQTKEEEWF